MYKQEIMYTNALHDYSIATFLNYWTWANCCLSNVRYLVSSLSLRLWFLPILVDKSL